MVCNFPLKCEQDKVYDDNLELSVAVLRKLYEQWKDLSVKLSPFDPLRETLKNFRQKVLAFCSFFTVSTYSIV